MTSAALHPGRAVPGADTAQRIVPGYRKATAFSLGLALCAVPLSIAVAESLLGIALLFRLALLFEGRERPHVPRIFWIWLVWAAIEIAVWLHSPDLTAGHGE